MGGCRLATLPVYNPATKEIIAELPMGGKSDVDKAVEAARKAFPVWSRKPQAERSQVAMKIAALLRENVDAFGKLDTLDHGTPTQPANFLPSAAPDNFEWAAYTPVR